MKMRLRNGRWYAAFKWKNRFIGQSLDAKEHELRRAERNLVRLFEDLEGGIGRTATPPSRSSAA